MILMDYSKKDQIHYLISPKNMNENIVMNSNTNFLYLQKNKIYELDFKDNTMNKMIKLSRKTLNSTIVIEDENVTLDSNNIYYKLKDQFNGKLKLEVKNNDALIEFLFRTTGASTINFRKSLHYNTTDKLTMVTISKEYFNKKLEFKIRGGKNFNFNSYFGYSIPPYTYYNLNDLNQYKPESKEENIYITIDDAKLMEGEYYCAFFQNLGDYLSITFSEKENEPEKKEGDDEGKGLESWKIALIVIGSILAVIIILVIIIWIKKKKGLSNNQIEDKMENLTNIV